MDILKDMGIGVGGLKVGEILSPDRIGTLKEELTIPQIEWDISGVYGFSIQHQGNFIYCNLPDNKIAKFDYDGRVVNFLNQKRTKLNEDRWVVTGGQRFAVDRISGSLLEGRSEDGTWINSDGSVAWSAQILPNYYYVRCLAIKKDYFCVGGSGGYIRKNNSSDASIVWGERLSSHTVNAIGIDSSDNVFGGTDDEIVFKINSAGDLQWTYNPANRDIRNLAVSPDGHVYSFGYNSSTFHKISPDGERIWDIDNIYSLSNIEFGDDGYVYTCDSRTNLKKYDVDGNEIWHITSPSVLGPSFSVDENGNCFIADSSMANRGNLVKISNLGKIIGYELLPKL